MFGIERTHRSREDGGSCLEALSCSGRRKCLLDRSRGRLQSGTDQPCVFRSRRRRRLEAIGDPPQFDRDIGPRLQELEAGSQSPERGAQAIVSSRVSPQLRHDFPQRP
jgi:hypothetical protein